MEKVIYAATKIQQWYKRYRRKLDLERQATWEICNAIENAEEQDEVNVYNFFSAMLSESVPTIQTLEDMRMKSTPDLKENEDFVDLGIDFPLKEKDCKVLFNYYRVYFID